MLHLDTLDGVHFGDEHHSSAPLVPTRYPCYVDGRRLFCVLVRFKVQMIIHIDNHLHFLGRSWSLV